MKTQKSTFSHLFVFLLCINCACHYDHGIAPLPGKLRVQVAFRGTAPENTQGIYLVVAPYFPPHAINELYHSPNSLSIDQDTVVTEIDLPYGKYEAFGLWWYSKDTKSNLADIFNMPHDGNTGLPIGFVLTPSQSVVDMYLNADWNQMHRDAAIKGTITFKGSFPDNTLATAVAAFKFKPIYDIHYLVWLKSVDFAIDPDKEVHHFTLPVRHGNIGYIAVFWLADHAPLTEIQIVGSYKDPETQQEGKFSIAEGDTIRDVDIYVDWSTHLHGETD
jgi:hypothetical protein